MFSPFVSLANTIFLLAQAAGNTLAISVASAWQKLDGGENSDDVD
jgi:hypothetical protein